MKIINARQTLTANGWQEDLQICIDKNGRIVKIGQPTAIPTASVDMLLPAPTNLHSHAFQRAMSGLTEARGPRSKRQFLDLAAVDVSLSRPAHA